MSEYQYYEFQTVDRRLSEMEMQELRRYSTRARITPTSFVNEYDWGSFKGNPDLWMEEYFDAHLYLANWGTHVLQLAVPAKLLSEKTASLYCSTDSASARKQSGRIILSFISEAEGCGDLIEGEGMLSSLLPVRADLVRGDLRCLYIGWLLSAQTGALDDDDREPPVPPNLGKLSGALSDFADFLRVDRELLAVAARTSPRIQSGPAKQEEMAAWVASLSMAEKDRLLVRLISGTDPHVGGELSLRFNRERTAGTNVAEPPRRTVAELLSARRQLD